MKRTAATKILLILAITLLKAHMAYGQQSHREIDVMLGVDLSGSMNQSDQDGKRYIGTDKFLSMCSVYGSNRAGVVSFGDEANIEIPFGYLSSDRSGQYLGILEGIHRGAAFTELGLGIDKCRTALGARDGHTKSIIIISDGIVEGNFRRRGGSESEANASADREIWNILIPKLKAAGIKVYTIGLIGGNTRGESTLQRLANETGGFYRRVKDPQEFTQIYEELLFNIGQGSAYDELNSGNSVVRLSPFDDAIIISGNSNMSATAPNGITYPREDSQNEVVKDNYVSYRDGSAILLLVKPGNLDKVNEYWSGAWTVVVNGPGKAIRFSRTRLIRDPELPIRSYYFLNEVVPIRARLHFDRDIGPNAKDLLDKCVAKYTIVCQDSDEGWTKTGVLNGKGNVFEGEEVITHPGNHLLQVHLYTQNPEKGEIASMTYQESFHVNKLSLMDLDVTYDKGGGEHPSVRDAFNVVSTKNPEAMTKENPEVRAFNPKLMNLRLFYNADKAIELEKIKPGSDGVLKADDLEFKYPGKLLIEGDMLGDLILQNPNTRELIPYQIKVRATKSINSIRSTWWPPAWVFWSSLISLFASALTIFGFFRKKDWRAAQSTALRDEWDRKTNLVEDDGISIFTKFRKPRFTIGGPSSGADHIVQEGGDEIIAEISVNRGGRYYITKLGQTDVYIDSKSKKLELKQKVQIYRDSRIFIGDETFNLSDAI